MAGIVGASRNAVQALCASVFSITLSKGAIQKMVDRVSEATLPHYTAIGKLARVSPVNYIDETAWLTGGDRRWLWVMANPLVAYFQIHANRSKAAFIQLIVDWSGILVSDGYSVSPFNIVIAGRAVRTTTNDRSSSNYDVERAGAMGIPRRAGCRSHQQRGGARPPIRCVVAQTQPGDLAVRRAIAGWSGYCRYGTHAVFVVGRRFPS
jgi:hypothetical protein